jgi:hypothetical protein
MICAENTVQGTALRRKLGLSVPVISLLAAILRAVLGFVAWAIERARRTLQAALASCTRKEDLVKRSIP